MTVTPQAAVDPMLTHPYFVREVAKETPDTFTLTIEPRVEEGSNSFAPGQFSMLWVFGVGELPISISGDPAKHNRLVYTVRSVGQATHALVSQPVGNSVGVRGPLGTGWPCEAARGKDVIIVAGGIGLAPLRPLVYRRLGQSQGIRPSCHPLWCAQPSRPALSQRTGKLGSKPRNPSAGNSRLWRAELERPCRRGHHVVQVRPASAGSTRSRWSAVLKS